MSKLLFKEIPLYPTDFKLDVWVGGTKKQIIGACTNRYLQEFHWYGDDTIKYSDGFVEIGNKKDGTPCIILWLETLEPKIAAHEIIHIIFALSVIADTEINQDSQEWVAQMTGYLFEKITDKKGYVNRS